MNLPWKNVQSDSTIEANRIEQKLRDTVSGRDMLCGVYGLPPRTFRHGPRGCIRHTMLLSCYPGQGERNLLREEPIGDKVIQDLES